ncbi:hypothetical protein CHS0354_037001 [Potamilus streckersoni]|uniref:TIR domain-containing protein n=1 Tax=Potamilus streckersoni TaxID=2493646 RepID=A0AAE0VY36_9BIVA|nr:hypothetical protein CHS0354_037001 [Potamilus streckersoni]
MEARQILQMSLPYNASSLHVLFLPNVTQVHVSFCTNVTETSLIELHLEGHANISPWMLEKERLSCFRKLHVLQLRDMSLTSIQTGTLSDMFYLEEFDVSRNRDLVIDHVIAAFQNSTVPKLRTFNISLIHSREDMNHIIMGREFFNIFKETDLKILDISWTRTSLIFVPISYYIPKVEVINMTGTFLVGNSVCMSSGLRLEKLRHMECNNWPYFVKSKRSIRSVVDPSCNSSYAGVYLHDGCYNLPPGLEVMYLEDINLKYVYFSFLSNMCFNPSNVLKFLSLRRLGWSSERPFSVIKGFIRLETLDLSASGLETISTETFRYMPSLKYLDLSNNNLHKMDITSFTLNGNLRVLDLSRNRLESFPFTMVSDNYMIKTLNLSQNALKSFSLNLSTNLAWTTIDLSYNKLQTLDLSEYYSPEYMDNTVNETVLVINITNNSIICDCSTDSARFMEWFLSRRNNSPIQLVPDSIVCGNYDSKVLKTYATYRQIMVEKCESDHIEIILAISIPVYACICIGYLATLVCCRNFLRRKRKTKYANGDYAVVENPKYIVFISASSYDTEFVRIHLLSKLEQELKSLINASENSDSELIASGDHIEVGKYIMNEIDRLVSSSLCLIVIMSDNFLKSEFCEYEFKHASLLKRRIIILYIQDCKQKINDKETSSFLQNAVRHYTYKQWPFQVDMESVVEEQKEENMIKELAVAISDIYRENEELLERERCKDNQIKKRKANTVGEKAP